MNCCNDFGHCARGEGCPLGSGTLRREIELKYGVATARPGRIGNTHRRKPALLGNAPSHWPKTLRLWRGRVKALVKWLAISAAAIVAVAFSVGVLA